MDKDEIKQTTDIRGIFRKYGVEIQRNGMCCCPFHGEKHPSMKVYKDSFYCFACGATGDVFTLTQFFEGCDFKDAFLMLGGEYKRPTSRKDAVLLEMKKKRAKQRAEYKSKELDSLNEKIRINNMRIHASRELMQNAEPFSEDWTFYCNSYENALIQDEQLREEVEKCKRSR